MHAIQTNDMDVPTCAVYKNRILFEGVIHALSIIAQKFFGIYIVKINKYITYPVMQNSLDLWCLTSDSYQTNYPIPEKVDW